MKVVVRLAGERGCRDVVVDTPRSYSATGTRFGWAAGYAAEYIAEKGERVVRVSETGYH